MFVNIAHRNQPTWYHELWDAFRGLILFCGLITVLLGGGTATLVVLYYMEHVSPAYCIATLGVFIYTGFCAMWVGMNHLN